MEAGGTPRRFTIPLLVILFFIGLNGCKRNVAPSSGKELEGQWRLVKAGGKAPESLHLKSYIINLNADGTWTAAGILEGGREGINLQDGGTWSLEGNAINYTARNKTGTSSVKLNGKHLTLDPDFVLHHEGKIPISGEYER
jgi:hypothetical protein